MDYRKLFNSSAEPRTSSISTLRYFFHLSSTLEGTVGSSSLQEPKLYYADARRQASNGQPLSHRRLKQPMVGRNTSPTSIVTHSSTCNEGTQQSWLQSRSRSWVLDTGCLIFDVDLWHQHRPPTSFKVDEIPIVRHIILF